MELLYVVNKQAGHWIKGYGDDYSDAVHWYIVKLQNT